MIIDVLLSCKYLVLGAAGRRTERRVGATVSGAPWRQSDGERGSTGTWPHGRCHAGTFLHTSPGGQARHAADVSRTSARTRKEVRVSAYTAPYGVIA